jgi:solute carrier family 25 carnitine/acylcarnitine transporter 20/29
LRATCSARAACARSSAAAPPRCCARALAARPISGGSPHALNFRPSSLSPHYTNSPYAISVYEGLRRALAPSAEAPPSTLAVLLAGGLAGVANWVVALPIDAVKSRIQFEALGGTGAGAGAGAGAESLSMRAVAMRLYREGGAKAFFRGFAPVLLRAFPANAACFFAMETSRAWLDRLA